MELIPLKRLENCHIFSRQYIQSKYNQKNVYVRAQAVHTIFFTHRSVSFVSVSIHIVAVYQIIDPTDRQTDKQTHSTKVYPNLLRLNTINHRTITIIRPIMMNCGERATLRPVEDYCRSWLRWWWWWWCWSFIHNHTLRSTTEAPLSNIPTNEKHCDECATLLSTKAYQKKDAPFRNTHALLTRLRRHSIWSDGREESA